MSIFIVILLISLLSAVVLVSLNISHNSDNDDKKETHTTQETPKSHNLSEFKDIHKDKKAYIVSSNTPFLKTDGIVFCIGNAILINKHCNYSVWDSLKKTNYHQTFKNVILHSDICFAQGLHDYIYNEFSNLRNVTFKNNLQFAKDITELMGFDSVIVIQEDTRENVVQANIYDDTVPEDIHIYMLTCDNSNYILDASLYMYRKYTNNKCRFTILGFKEPKLHNTDNVEFVSLGENQDISKWSLYLYTYFSTIDEKSIFISLDDSCPIDYINIDCFNSALKLMNTRDDIGTFNPGYQPWVEDTSSVMSLGNDFAIYKHNTSENCKINLQPCVWNREYFLCYLKNECTPWTFELGKTLAAHRDNFIAMSSSSKIDNYKCCFPMLTHTMLSGRVFPNKEINVLGMTRDDIEYMINHNYLDEEKLRMGMGTWSDYYTDVKDNFKFESLESKINNENEWTDHSIMYDNFDRTNNKHAT
jgi:hypothetical protein